MRYLSHPISSARGQWEKGLEIGEPRRAVQMGRMGCPLRRTGREGRQISLRDVGEDIDTHEDINMHMILPGRFLMLWLCVLYRQLL